MIEALKNMGPFATVLDVGGNVGDFAARAHDLWPKAAITSFEPIPALASVNAHHAQGRWKVERVAISDREGIATIHVCENQPSASTMQTPGTVRRERFGIGDYFTDLEVPRRPLDDYLSLVSEAQGRILIKIDVEGHEAFVLKGAKEVLAYADTVIVEVQQSPQIFLGSPSPLAIDHQLRACGLIFNGVVDALKDRNGEIVQFDGVWVIDDV